MKYRCRGRDLGVAARDPESNDRDLHKPTLKPRDMDELHLEFPAANGTYLIVIHLDDIESADDWRDVTAGDLERTLVRVFPSLFGIYNRVTLAVNLRILRPEEHIGDFHHQEAHFTVVPAPRQGGHPKRPMRRSTVEAKKDSMKKQRDPHDDKSAAPEPDSASRLYGVPLKRIAMAAESMMCTTKGLKDSLHDLCAQSDLLA